MSSKSSSTAADNRSNSLSDTAPGTFVQYDDDGKVILGIVTGSSKKDKVSVLNERGRELELARPRLHVLPSASIEMADSVGARVTQLQDMAGKIEGEARTFDVAELWSFIHEEIRPYTPAELATLYLGSATVITCGALRVALITERTHFKRDRDLFEPRPPHVVEDLLRAMEAKKVKQAIRERTLGYIEEKAKDPGLEVPTEIRDSFRLLEEAAASIVHTDPARQKEAREFVHACASRLRIPETMPVEKQAFEVLHKIGIFHEHTNLALIRHGIPVQHSAEIESEANAIQIPVMSTDYPADEREFRIDLSSAFAFTIDDISTRDMDDALSLERTAEGYELGIHITDVAAVVMPDSGIDRAARRRATSLYLADQTINMLPNRLSEETCSLRENEIRPCLSVLVKLTESLDIVSTQVCGTFIKVSRRYSYDEVDDLLEQGDERLLMIHDIAAACDEHRIRNGAVRVQKREVVPVFESGTICLREIEEDSPARLLVSEMMVLANTTMAEFAAMHKIPVLFRGQERSDASVDVPNGAEEAPEGPAKDFSARTRLKKSSVSFEPIHHAGLGVGAYIQATSPIRRYIDLCHQRQILSYLKTKKPWIPLSDFEKLAAEVEMPVQQAGLASRETKRYWLLRYLEQRDPSHTIVGTVVRVDLKTPLVELDEVYITVPVRFQNKVALGQRVDLKITALDAHGDYVRLTS